MAKIRRRVRWWEHASSTAKAVAGIITALGVIVSGLIGFSSHVQGIIVSEVSERLDGLETHVNAIHQDTVRLQLTNMIFDDPENTETILNIAREYFLELKGDWYATAIFEEWANEHEIDITAFGDLK